MGTIEIFELDTTAVILLQLAKSMFHSITLNTSNCQFSPHRDKSFLPLQIRIDPGHYERYHTVAYAWARKWWHTLRNEFNIEKCWYFWTHWVEMYTIRILSSTYSRDQSNERNLAVSFVLSYIIVWKWLTKLCKTRDFLKVPYYKLPREYAKTFTFLQKSYAIAEIIIFFFHSI